MLLEVYTEQDKEKLINQGLKMICTRKSNNSDVFVFEYRKNLKFDLSEVKYRLVNKLYF